MAAISQGQCVYAFLPRQKTLGYTFRRRFKLHFRIWVKKMIKMHFSYLKISLNTSSAKWRQHCLWLNVLTRWDKVTSIYTEIKCKRHWQIHFQIQMTHKKFTIFILENEFENVVYKMTAVSFMSQCVKNKKIAAIFKTTYSNYMSSTKWRPCYLGLNV